MGYGYGRWRLRRNPKDRLRGVAKSGSVLKVLHELEDIVETKMGGTLGAILGIFFRVLVGGPSAEC